MWADVRCAPSFTQHSYVCLCFYKRHVVWPLCVCVYGSWLAGWLAGWLVWGGQKRCVGRMLTQFRHKYIFTTIFPQPRTYLMSKMQSTLINALYSAVQYTTNMITSSFSCQRNNGEASFVGARIPQQPHPL